MKLWSDIMTAVNKLENRRARAAMQKDARNQRTDLDQLILICTTPARGGCTKERLRLIKNLRDRYENDPKSLQAVNAELKKAVVKITI
jgi:hypothetical protein